MAEYCEFLDEFGPRLYGYFALDVVNNPKATDENLREMLRNGYKPIPIHVVGDDEKRMDELFELTDYIALAGVMRPQNAAADKALVDKYIKLKMQWAAGRKVHWLGVTRQEMLAAYRPYSSDSNSWKASQMFGHLGVYLGNGRWVKANGFANRKRVLKNAEAMAVCRRVVPDWDSVCEDPKAWRMGKGNLDCVANIAADSWVRFVMDFYQFFGTRVFMVAAPGKSMRCGFPQALERHRKRMGYE